VHYFGGLAALIGAACIGPRKGRWDEIEAANFAPHNVPTVLGGALVLWIGWYGFNVASVKHTSSVAYAQTSASIVLVTTISASASGLASMLLTRLAQRHSKFDAMCLPNGVVAGLVGISAGCDAISPAWSLAVGAVSASVYVLTVEAVKRMRVDDVVNAFAVHGGGGSWSLLAVGLLHKDTGLITTGVADQLWSQLLGFLLLSALLVPFAGATLVLRRLKLLRVGEKEEEEGLDTVFGLHAYERHSNFVARHRMISSLLNDAGYSAEQLLEALRRLDDIICRPLSPQGGDFRLEGEVKDILRHLTFDQRAVEMEHLVFISHFKANGGEAARILADTAKRLMIEGALEPGNSAGSTPSNVSPKMPRVPVTWEAPQPPKASYRQSNAVSQREGFSHASRQSNAVSHPVSHRSTFDINRASVRSKVSEAESSLYGSAANDSTDGGTTVPARPPINALTNAAIAIEAHERCRAASRAISRRSRCSRRAGGTQWMKKVLSQFGEDELLFLDSASLNDKKLLSNHVLKSSNYVLLLTHNVLERPWVLFELCTAYWNHKNIVVVMVEGLSKDSLLRWPAELDRAISNWSWYLRQGRQPASSGHGLKSSSGGTLRKAQSVAANLPRLRRTGTPSPARLRSQSSASGGARLKASTSRQPVTATSSLRSYLSRVLLKSRSGSNVDLEEFHALQAAHSARIAAATPINLSFRSVRGASAPGAGSGRPPSMRCKALASCREVSFQGLPVLQNDSPRPVRRSGSAHSMSKSLQRDSSTFNFGVPFDSYKPSSCCTTPLRLKRFEHLDRPGSQVLSQRPSPPHDASLSPNESYVDGLRALVSAEEGRRTGSAS